MAQAAQQNNILNYALYNQQFGASLDAIGALNAIRSNQAHGPNQPGQLGIDIKSGRQELPVCSFKVSKVLVHDFISVTGQIPTQLNPSMNQFNLQNQSNLINYSLTNNFGQDPRLVNRMMVNKLIFLVVHDPARFYRD